MNWAALVGLGAFHGVNPGMGWLFAVALGLQEGSRSKLVRSLLPIAVGHELSIAAVAVVIEVAESVAARRLILVVGGLGLIGFGVWRLVSRRHLRWVGMRLGWADLVLWSFLMSSAHGAGFMLFPVLAHDGHGSAATPLGGLDGSIVHAVAAAAVHSGAMLVTMGAVAVIVYEAVGLDILRRAWVNLDRVWAFALIAAGVASVLL
ncbi:MAG: hypothetical protein ACRD29_11200 [Acidimicrobiales bacterium]